MAQSPARTTKLGNHPMPLAGPALRPGDVAPDFTLIGTDLGTITLGSTGARTRIFVSLLSFDTSVCDLEMKTFARRAGEIPDAMILAVSVDLPFTQRRWCLADGFPSLVAGSDHRDVNFGRAYGVLMEPVRQLARAAFVVDSAGVIRYAEYVPEAGEQPNYDAVIRAAQEAHAVRA